MKNRRIRTMLAAVSFGVTLLAIDTASVAAAPGDLDLSFGSGGRVIADFNFSSTAHAVVLQPDGKMIVVGEGRTNSPSDFLVARYNTDGSLDTSFGSGGLVLTDFFGSDHAIAVILQPDGKIVAAGASDASGIGNSNFALARYNADGSLDSTFGIGGKVVSDIDTGNDRVRSLVLQTDGKMVVAGSHSPGNGGESVLVRYNSNGSLDSTFGNAGKVFNIGYSAYDLALQADGKIVTAGWDSEDFALARYNPNGTFDTTFGTGGRVTTDNGSVDLASEVIVQPDGKILAAGTGYYLDPELGLLPSGYVLVRLHPNGSLDTSFGSRGSAFMQTNAPLEGLALQSDGKIITSGPGEYISEWFTLARFHSSGIPDATFGSGGRVITGFNAYCGAYGVVVQPDGKIVAAGSAGLTSPTSESIGLARFRGGSVGPQRTKFDFDNDSRADLSVFRQTDSTWYLNRSLRGSSATQFGLSTDKIAPADFDGDGQTDIAVYRDGVWYWINSFYGTFGVVQFGLAGDIPQPADFTGDGRAEIAIYRGGTWWNLDLANDRVNTNQFGLASDKAVVADYDGDGRSDQAVFRNGEWHLNRSSGGYTVLQWGLPTDRPAPADYDGDGKTDLAVYRDGTWYVWQSSEGFAAFQFGLATDIPTPADYDGDGKADAAVFRDGIWYLRQTTSGFAVTQFGLANDRPVPAAYLP